MNLVSLWRISFVLFAAAFALTSLALVPWKVVVALFVLLGGAIGSYYWGQTWSFRRFSRGRTLKELAQRWGAAPGWIGINGVILLILNKYQPAFFDRLIRGDLSWAYYGLNFLVFLRGSFLSWPGDAARKFYTRVADIMAIVIVVMFFLEYSGAGLPSWAKPDRRVEIPARYEPYAEYDPSGRVRVGVTPDQYDSGYPVMLRVLEVDPNTLSIIIEDLEGEVFVDGEIRGAKDGILRLRVGDWDGAPEYEVIGEGNFRLPFTPSGSWPVYAFIPSNREGTGIIKFEAFAVGMPR